jgi:membrane protease YdiL (CAAX protease family)
MPAIELQAIDLFLIGWLALATPLFGALYSVPRIRALSPAVQDALRPRIYVNAMAVEWLFVAAALQVVILRDYPWSVIGVALPTVIELLLGGAALAVLGALLLLARRSVMKQPDGASQVRESARHLEWLLPRGPRQRRLWWAVSVHAGLGEELFYRGYLFAVLASIMPPLSAAVVGMLIFGFAHVYQGVRGILLTSALGGVFMGLYYISGSLWVPMLAHALYDIYAGELGYWAFSRQPDAARSDHP